MTALLAAIPPPFDNAFQVGPLTVHFYGIAVATGVLLAITILRNGYVARGGSAELADRVALWGVGLGFVGARAGYVLPRMEWFGGRFSLARPLELIAINEGGIVLYGGLTLGLVTVLLVLRRRNGDIPAFLDALAPAVPAAQAVGRLGNYFNQELYGTRTEAPWALQIAAPDGTVIDTVHPTFAYEALWNLALAALLWQLGRRRVLPMGSLAFVYAIGYGIIRFLLEFVRTDERAFTYGLTANGWVSVAVIAAGVVGLLVWRGRAPAAEDAEPVDGSEPERPNVDVEEDEPPRG